MKRSAHPKRVSPAFFYLALILCFLYTPLLVMALFSFNSIASTARFSAFSVYWYQELLQNETARQCLQNSLFLALTSAVVSVILGTVAAFGIDCCKQKRARALLLQITNLPLINPEIVTGISLMLLFVFVSRLLHLSTTLGFFSLLAAHVTFCLPYVILSVLPKLRQMDPHLSEAARDLGCSSFGAFFRVILPNISTGIASAFLMAFTISLDDFVVSNFTSGPSYQTLPLYIYAMTKKRVKPDMYALSTFVFFAVFLLLWFSHFLNKNLFKSKKNTPSI